jgi:hypothetical protein
VLVDDLTDPIMSPAVSVGDHQGHDGYRDHRADVERRG